MKNPINVTWPTKRTCFCQQYTWRERNNTENENATILIFLEPQERGENEDGIYKGL